MKVSIGKKAALIIAIPIAIVIFLTLFSYQENQRSIQYSYWINHTIDAMTAVRSIRSQMKVVQTEQLGFLKTGKESYINSYNSATGQVWQNFNNVRQLTKDNPVQQKRLDTIKSLITVIIAEFKKTIDVKRLQGNEAAEAIVLTDAGTQAMESFQKVIIQMLEEETVLLKKRNMLQQEGVRRLNKISMIGYLLALLFSIVTGFLFYRINRYANELKSANDKIRLSLKEIEHSKNDLDRIVNALGNPVFVKDRQHRWVLLNDAMCEFMRFKREALIGKSDYDFFPKEEADEFQRKDELVFTTQATNINEESFTDADGVNHFILTKKVYYKDVENKEYIVGIITDITERKKSEQALEEAYSNLQKSNKELDNFSYTVSHDLRAPLRSISSFATFLEQDYKDKLEEKGQDYLLEIRKGIKRMEHLFGDLLKLSQISRIKNPYEETDINALVHFVADYLSFDIEKNHVELIIGSNMPSVVCDSIKIREVFLNLISNAIKFSSKNNKEAPKVEIGYNDRGEFHEFFIKDNGIGIEPDYHEQVFGIFRRLHSSAEYEGTGAGLAIIKRIIDEHAGHIWIKSELNQGAIFLFTIPKSIPKK